MSSAWLLPEHIADVLPVEARRIEGLRRRLLDRAQAYGYELIAPPMLEHLGSLLSGTGSALDLATFKLVDQLSGRTLGLRADTTIQAARIDAHLLNREGVTRLCYCGPVLHTRPAGLYASREPLQFGAEVFGHAGLEADLEVLDLAVDCLQLAGVAEPVLDLADARILSGVLADETPAPEALAAIVDALSAKDAPALAACSDGLRSDVRAALAMLLQLYGGDEVLAAARDRLPRTGDVQTSIDQLEWLGRHLQAAHPEARLGFDLSDMSGYAYYSGPRFAIYGAGATDPLARGGRYDEVGAAFGRNRPAAGFSLDLKSVAALPAAAAPALAIQAPWGESPELRTAVRSLRDAGETVIAVLPGHAVDAADVVCDRELVRAAGRWVVQARTARSD
jgi:ATP phosphoribosyltransferase regulatory subunit